MALLQPVTRGGLHVLTLMSRQYVQDTLQFNLKHCLSSRNAAQIWTPEHTDICKKNKKQFSFSRK